VKKYYSRLSRAATMLLFASITADVYGATQTVWYGGGSSTGPTGVQYSATNPTGQTSFTESSPWPDADKSYVGGAANNQCWAATASDMLYFNGWGARGGFQNENEMFAYFRNMWTNNGGYADYGVRWYLSTTMYNTDPAPTGAGWAEIANVVDRKPMGNWYSSYTTDASVGLSTLSLTGLQTTAKTNMATMFTNNKTCQLAIYTATAGHAVALWGYEYDDATNYLSKIYIADNQKDTETTYGGTDVDAGANIRAYTVTWDAGNSRYNIDGFWLSSGATTYMEDITGVSRNTEQNYGVWTGASSTAFGTTGNWADWNGGGSDVPLADTAWTFNEAATNKTVLLGGDQTVAKMIFNNTTAYTIDNGGSANYLIFGGRLNSECAGAGIVKNGTGDVTINSKIALKDRYYYGDLMDSSYKIYRTDANTGGTITLAGTIENHSSATLDASIFIEGDFTVKPTADNSATFTGSETYGAWVIRKGTLEISALNQLGASTNDVWFDGATGAGNYGSISFTNDATWGASQIFKTAAASDYGAISVADTKTLTLGTAAQLVSVGTIYKTGLGTMVLNAANTGTTGTLEVTGGILRASAANVVGTGAKLSAGSGGTLQIENASAVPTDATLRLNGGTLEAYGGSKTIATPLLVTASSTIGGSNDISFSAAFGSIELSDAGNRTLTVNNTGTTTFTNGALISNDASARTLTLAGTGNVTFSSGLLETGVPAGGHKLTINKSGGVVILAGAGDYTGLTTVTAGALNIQNASSLGTTAAGTTVSSGGTLQIQGGIAVGTEALTLNGAGFSSTGAVRNISGNNSWAGNVTLGTDSTIQSDAGDLTLSGVVSGSRALTKTGAGSLTLSNANTYTLATNVNAGTLAISNASSLGTTANGTIVSDGGTLQMSGSITVAGEALTLNGLGAGSNGALRSLSGDNTWNNAITLASSSGVQVDANSLTLSGVVSGVGFGVTKTGAGTLIYGAANAYTGATVVSAGMLKLGAAGVIADTSALTVSGTLDLNGNSETVGSLAGVGTVTSGAAGTLTITAGGDNSSTAWSGVVENGTATSVGLTKAGAGTLTVSGANTYTGTTTVSAGTVTLGASDRFSNSSALAMNGGTLDLATFSERFDTLRFTTATIDFVSGGAAQYLIFSDDGTVGGTLSVNNFNYNAGSGDKFGFVTNAISASFLSGMVLNGGDSVRLSAGTTAFGSYGSFYEIIPIVNQTWDGGGGNANWGTAGNWDNSDTAWSAGNKAVFASAFTSGSGVKLDSNVDTYGITSTTNTDFSIDPLAAQTLTIQSGGITKTSGTAAMTISAPVVLGTAQTWNIGTGSLTVSGVVSGSDTLTKSGAGTLTLSGANTYTGTTTVSNGTVNIQNATAFGTTAGGVTVASGAEIQLQGGIAVGAESLSIAGTGTGTAGVLHNISGNNSWAGAVTMTADSTIGSDTGTLTLGGDIGGGYALTKVGAGTVVLSGNNSYTGATAVNAGALNLQHANAAGTTAGGVTVESGAALQLQGGISVGVEALTIKGTGISNDGALRNISGSNSWAGAVTISTSAGRINSDAGLLTVGGGITSTNLGLTVGGAGNVTIDGAIGTGTGILTKDGTGTLTLTASNTLTGAARFYKGTTILSGANGTLNNSTGGNVVLSSGTLTLDNTTNNTNRIKDGSSVTVTENGTLNWTHTGSAGVAYSETLGALTATAAGTVFHVNASQSASDGSSVLTFASNAATALTGDAIVFKGTGLGATDGIGRNRVVFTNSANTTPANGSMKGWFISTDNGATYGLGTYSTTADGASVVGVTPVAAGSYDTASADTAWGAAILSRPTGDVTMSGAKSLAALVLDNGIDLLDSGGSKTLTMVNNQATIIANGTNAIASNNNLAMSASEKFIFTNGTLTLGGNITSVSGALMKLGTGSLVTSTALSITGTTNLILGEGTIRATTNASALGSGTAALTLVNGTLELANDTGLNYGRNTTFGGDVTILSDRLTGGLGVTHTLGTWAMGTTASTAAGSSTITVGKGANVSSGTAGITFGGNASLTTGVAFNVNTGAQLNLGAITPNASVQTITKLGAGTLAVTGIIADNGAGKINITQSAGTLLLNAVNTGTGTIQTVGGTVGGTGTISQAITVKSGVSLLAGDGFTDPDTLAQTLTVSGDLTVENGATFVFALGLPGAHSTLARTSGTWSLAANQVTFLDFGATAGAYNDIITGLAGDPGMSSWTITNSGWSGSFVYDAGTVDLNITAVPEPSTIVLLLVGVAAIVINKRRFDPNPSIRI